MRKLFVITAAILATSLTSALAAPAPQFNTAVKFGEGKIRTGSNRVAIDGANLYAAFGTYQLDGSTQTRVVSSTNSGATWKLSEILQTSDANVAPDMLSVRVQVSNDPLYTGKKLVHAIWTTSNTEGGGSVYYAYKADRPTLNGWSTPVAIFTDSWVDGMGNSLMVTNNGAVHVVNGSNHIYAASPDDVFYSEPIPVVGSIGTPQAVMDATGNLFVVNNSNGDLYFTKKMAGTTIWTDPVLVYSGATNWFGIQVADANTCYVAYHDGISNLSLSVSTDGGINWTKRTVLANQTTQIAMGNGSYNPVVAVAAGKITYVSESFDTTGINQGIKVLRSSDNGVTWTAPVTIQGQECPSITLDSNGKAHILVRDEITTSSENKNLLYIKEK